jgi:uncharacterized protein
MSPLEQMLGQKVWAVVGASENRQKFGYKILMFLQKKGYKVYGVNPGTANINGIPCFPDLGSLPEKPDVVNLVVPPDVCGRVWRRGLSRGSRITGSSRGQGTNGSWKPLMHAGVQLVFNHCVMVEARGRPGENL